MQRYKKLIYLPPFYHLIFILFYLIFIFELKIKQLRFYSLPSKVKEI